ncbi:autotransporter domain-containing protein [Sinorhizobium meliloti]|uniref:autotransporter outer membrane beta-barrel domain-containing protein n=1 Tax=Rhizobium meliloti TaxID=382 RepID=UPI0012978021|nr:autotransporter outer membrane beta-barrel domain-containing protein [Sinorhizobium meliloti]MDW9433495.1 autotransporter domain-containing protein [Sinorhizobium meliloti]MQV77965.1 autotransporter domain-containing protein [Sinorhizobium meliloti]
MRLIPATVVLCGCLLISTQAAAQSLPPLRTNFETYSQAISRLLGAGSAICGFTTTVDDLTILPNNPDPFAPPPRSGPIGPNLSRHCTPNTDTNLAGGSVIAGGMSSLQSTRTVSQFDVARRRSEPCDPSEDEECAEIDGENEIVSNYFYQDGATHSGGAFSSLLDDGRGRLDANLYFPSEGFAIFGQFEYEDFRQSSTRFEPAKDLDIFTAEVGVQWNLSAESIIGLTGSYSGASGVSLGPEQVTVRSAPNLDPPIVFTGNFENECGVPRNGKIDTDDFSGSVFYQTKWMENGFLAAEVGANRGRIKYRNSACTINLDENLVPPTTSQTAGIISGNPELFGLSANFNAGYDWDYIGVNFGPRLSLDTSWTNIDEYSETESAGRLGFPITGTSLRYEEQDIMSVQTRIGFAVSKPFSFNNSTIVPFVQLDYIHEFENDQRRIKATFVEDGRPDPFAFTFKTNPPDRNFFELNGGLLLEISDGGVAYVNGRVVLANDLVDVFGVTGGLRVRF